LKKSLVVGHKGPDAKTNSLAVNRQSQSNFDFDINFEESAVGREPPFREGLSPEAED
jgi:hypothetical protein